MSTPGTHDARDGSGDPQDDPAALGERRLQAEDGDGGAVPHEELPGQTAPEPGTGG